MNQENEAILIKADEELRCPQCNKLLAKGTADTLEIKCPRCKQLCRFMSL